MDDHTCRALYEARWTRYHTALAIELAVGLLLLALILWRVW